MNDPLTDLMLTYDTYQRMSKTVRQLVHLGTRKLVVTGGGGYNAVAAAKIWTILLADIADIALPPTIPAEWIELCQSHGFQVKRGGWTSRPFRMPSDQYPKIRRAVDDTIQKVKELIFPTFGLEDQI